MEIEGQINFQDVIGRSSRMDVALSAAFMRTAQDVSLTLNISTLHTIPVTLALDSVSDLHVIVTEFMGTPLSVRLQSDIA
jgi:hypothetical protein